MKLNFSLDKLELYLDDDILLAADNLINAQKLVSLSQIEKNLFIASFTEGGDNIETEVQFVGTKVKVATCECADFHEKEICGHIGAALLTLLERRKARGEARKAASEKAAQNTETPKLTIPNILKHIEAPQLIEFIADYARNDKQFALALKTRFASDLSSGTVEENYKTLIDNTLRAAKNPRGRITPKGWQQVFTMIDELRQKAESLFKTGELSHCFDVIKVTLPLVHRLMRTSESPKSKIERRQVLLSELLRGYDTLLVSPELAQQMWDFILTEYAQNCRQEFSTRLFDALLKKADTEIRVNNLLQTIDTQIVACRQFLDIKDKLMTQKVQVLQKSGRVEEASTLILSVSANPDVLLFAVENALTNHDYELAKSLCENGLQIFNKNQLAREALEENLLTIAENTADTEGVYFYAERRLLATFRYDFYLRLKQINLTPQQKSDLIEKIENQTYRIEKRDLLAAIYLEEKELDKLTNMIMELQSLELLRRYGVDLYDIDAEDTIELHKKVFYEYLFTHLGRPPAQRIRQVLESLIARDGRPLAERLKADIKKDFPERYSLNEELNDMMEDLEKKAILEQKGTYKYGY